MMAHSPHRPGPGNPNYTEVTLPSGEIIKYWILSPCMVCNQTIVQTIAIDRISGAHVHRCQDGTLVIIQPPKLNNGKYTQWQKVTFPTFHARMFGPVYQLGDVILPITRNHTN